MTGCAAPEFLKEIAYEMTQWIITRYEMFADDSPRGKWLSPEALPWEWDEKDIHPEALKAYKEAGISK